MSGPLINVPRDHFEKLASVPLELAQIEAQRMLAAGDAAGASRRIAEGVQQSAAMRAQVMGPQPVAGQPAIPGQPAAAPMPEPTQEQRVAAALEQRLTNFGPLARQLMTPAMRQHFIRQAEADAGIVRDPRLDVTQPMWLTAPLPSKPRI